MKRCASKTVSDVSRISRNKTRYKINDALNINIENLISSFYFCVSLQMERHKHDNTTNLRKVFLGGLPSKINEMIIHCAFEPVFGPVSLYFLNQLNM